MSTEQHLNEATGGGSGLNDVLGGWMTIDTCPLDVDVLIGGGDCPGVQINALRKAGKQYCFKALGERQQPTYWMPIPKPPNAELVPKGD